jgi:release factor glutamine methyltransferase
VTLSEALYQAAQTLTTAGIKDARLDAELLLGRVLGRDRTWLFTHANDLLDRAFFGPFEELIARRARREPVQYILGSQEFWGRSFRVTPAVLIPRPETELLVERAAGILNAIDRPTVIDLCTGSGCIAVSLAKELRSPRIFATDISESALEVARANAAAHACSNSIRFLAGDLFEPVAELDLRGRVDCITANPPYISSSDLRALQPEVRDFEPEHALIAGPAGTEIHARIIREAPFYLKSGATLMMEMGIGQAPDLIRMTAAAGAYGQPEIVKDLAGIDRVIILREKR